MEAEAHVRLRQGHVRLRPGALSLVYPQGGGGVVSSGVRVMLTPRGYAMLPFNQGPGLSCTHMEPLSGPGFMGPAVYAAARYFAASH